MANLKVDETFTIERDSNAPSTGYDWLLVKLDGPASLVHDKFRHESDSGNVSGHGKKLFVFEALGEGTAYVQLAYMRPWEPGKAIYEDVLPFVIEKADAEPAANELLGTTAGGWTPFGPLNADAEAVFKEAFANLVGVDYKPLLAAVQTVNAKISRGGNAYAAFICVYKALNTKASITKLGHPSFAGSYGAFETVSTGAKAALDEARRTGLDFEPNYAATQIVAGRNYLFAGNAKYVTLHAHEFPAFVTVSKPLEGKSRITSVKAAYEM
jgi:predicted secreted protein